jgi:hypothetical protein
MTETSFVKTEAAVAAVLAEDGSDSIIKSRKPEGKFELFLMDFDIAGTNKTLYPAVIKTYRGTRGDKKAENTDKNDYLAARYAIGRARSYIIDELGLPRITSTQAGEFIALTPGIYEQLAAGKTRTQIKQQQSHDPEKTAVTIQTGKPVRIGISGVINQTGVVGQTQNVGIVGPIQLRIPTLVSIRQFAAWIGSAKGPSDKTKLSYILLAGGRQVPIAGGAVQPNALIDGPG